MHESKELAEVRFANSVFLNPNLVEVSVLDKDESGKETVVRMSLNAQGLMKALELGIIHCYQKKCDSAAMMAQIRQLRLNSVEQALSFLHFLSPWSKISHEQLLDAFAYALVNREVKPIEPRKMGEREISALTGRELCLYGSPGHWHLLEWPEEDKDDDEEVDQELKQKMFELTGDADFFSMPDFNQPSCDDEVIWQGSELSAEFFMMLAKRWPAVTKFVDLGF